MHRGFDDPLVAPRATPRGHGPRAPAATGRAWPGPACPACRQRARLRPAPGRRGIHRANFADQIVIGFRVRGLVRQILAKIVLAQANDHDVRDIVRVRPVRIGVVRQGALEELRCVGDIGAALPVPHHTAAAVAHEVDLRLQPSPEQHAKGTRRIGPRAEWRRSRAGTARCIRRR